MMPRLHLLDLTVTTALAALAAIPVAASAAPATSAAKAPPKPTVFKVCRSGCRYTTIQRAVDAAGSYAYREKRAKVVVAVQPSKYPEGVVLDGTEPRRRFDGMTIEGTRPNPRRTILEGRGAAGVTAPNGIDAIGVTGLVLKNMWARGYEADGFFVHASERGDDCAAYAMENLLASGNGSSGLAARSCRGGKMIESSGYHDGEAAFSVSETPCESASWSVYGREPCQVTPRWTLLMNDRGYENTLGYAGPNAKYVRVLENVFFDDGTGIVADTVEGEGWEPNGWNAIERNDVFWNNYNPFLADAGFRPPAAGMGESSGHAVNYPTGTGIVLYGGTADVVRSNLVFGNYKWGIASFSGPAHTYVLNPGDEAKSVDNEIAQNVMGRGGADPNGEYDFFNDASGGGNCWGANSPRATFAPGNGKVPQGQIYPVCPQAQANYPTVSSTNLEAGLLVAPTEIAAPKTLLGYAGAFPAQDQQCSWVRRVAAHPIFQEYEPVEVTARPGELSC
jgi:hypothetical protein